MPSRRRRDRRAHPEIADAGPELGGDLGLQPLARRDLLPELLRLERRLGSHLDRERLAEALVDLRGLVPAPRQRQDPHESHRQALLEGLYDQRTPERRGGFVEFASSLEQTSLFIKERHQLRPQLVEGWCDPILVSVVGE